MKKKGKRWLALILAVALVGTNALYQAGTQMSASESETEQQTAGAEDEMQSQDSSVNADTADTQNQDQGDQSVQVQEVPSAETNQNEESSQENGSNNQRDAVAEQQAGDNAGQQVADQEEKTVDVKIQKSDVDGGQIVAWGVDGNKAEVTYDGNNQYVKTVKEGESFNFEVTAKTPYKVSKVTDQNGTEIQPKAVNDNVYTYKVTNITTERVFNITYNKEETKSASENNDQKKSDDEKSDDSDDEGDSPAVQTASEEVMTDFYVGADRTSVTVGDTVNVKAIIKPDDYSNKNVTWKSSDNETATVDASGVVTTLKTGIVTITGTSEANSEYTDSVVIQINPVSVTSVKINGYNEEYLTKNNTVQLTATVEPQNAEDKDLTWSSSDEKVATVDQNGKVTAKGQGTAVIRAENSASGKYAEQKITVYATAPQKVTVHIWVTNQNQNKTYTFYIPKDGTVVNASSVHQSVTGYVTTGDIRVRNGKWSAEQPEWGTIQKNETVKRFRYYKNQLQYSISTSGNSWENVGNNDIVDFCESLRQGDSSSDTDVKVVLGDWPYGDNAGTGHNQQTIRIEVVEKDDAGDSTVVYNSGTMRYDNGSDGQYGKIKFNCDESRYEVEKVIIYKIDAGNENVIQTYTASQIPENGIDVKFSFGQTNHYIVKAIVTPKKFNVKYDANGGNNAPASKKITAVNGHQVTVASSPEPTRENYIFAGWEYNGTTYYGGESFEMPPSNVTFVAKWIPASTAISYKSNNADWGTVSRSHEIVKDGATAKGSVANAKEGYEFVEWQDADGKQVSTDKFYQPKEKAGSYTAVFRAKTYNVTYQFTGTVPKGATTPETGKFEFNSKVTAAEVTDVPGYTFEGWTSQDVTLKNGTFTMPAKNVTLTGTWKQKDGRFGYYLSLKDATWQGGTPDNLEVSGTSSQNLPKYAEKVHYSYGDKYNVISNVPTAEGHAFIGWLDKKRGNQSAAIRSAGDKLTYIYKAGDENQAYTLDALWASIAAEGGEYTYDGENHQITADIAINEGLNLDAKYVEQAKKFIKTGTMEYSTDKKTWSTKNPSFKDAGTYTVYVRQDVTVGGNTKPLEAKAEIVIKPRGITLTSATAEKVYDGTALANDKVTVKGDGFVTGEGATYKVTGSQTDVGESSNTFTYALNKGTNVKNYTITTTEGMLKVTPVTDKVTVTITGNTGGEKYNGEEQAVSGYRVSIDNKLYKKADFTFSGTAEAKGTNAGNYPMGLQVSDFTNISKNFTNVEFVVKDGHLDIAKRKVTLTSATDEKVYDGTALTNDTVTVSGDGFVTGEGATYDVTGSQTDEGTSDNTFTYALNDGTNQDNYDITPVTGSLTVKSDENEVVVKIVGNTETKTYNGKEQKVTGYTVSISGQKYKEKDFSFKGKAEAKGTDAGTYNMNLKVSDFVNNNKNYKNVKFVVTDGTLTINKRNVTLTSASASKTYDGKALTNSQVTVDGDKFAEGEGAVYDVTGKITNVGTTDNTFTYTLSDGTKADNYTIETKNGTLEVTPVTDEVVVTIKGNTVSTTYDGTEHSSTGYTVESVSNTAYSANNVELNPGVSAEAKGTDAGTYYMGLTASSFKNTSNNFTNVKFVVTDGSLTIGKRSVTLTSADANKTYDGTALTNKTVTVSGDGFVEGEGVTYNVTGTITNVGTTENTFDYTLSDGTKADNYTIETKNGTLEVTPVTAKVTVNIKGHNGNLKYNGGEQSVAGYDVTAISNLLYTANDFTFNGNETAKGTDVGIYQMGLKASDFANNSKNFTNVEFVVEDGTLTIEKRNVTLTSGSASKPYDGTAITKDEVTVSGDGFANGEGATYEVTGSRTNVGTSDNEFKYNLNEGTSVDNYNISLVKGKLTITPDDKEVVVTITENSQTVKYDGSEKTVTGYQVTSISNPLYTANDFTFSGDATVKGTNAGTYDMKLKASDFQNTSNQFSKVKFVIVDGTLTIEKRNVTLTSGSANRPYNGEKLTNPNVAVGGDGFAENQGASFKVTGEVTNVGKVSNAFAYTLNENTNKDNYNITKSEGTLEVTPVTSEVVVTITGKTATEKYDGSEKEASGYDITSISNSLYKNSDFEFNGKAVASRTDAGYTAMGLTEADFRNANSNFTNVKFEVTDGGVTVEKRTVIMTSATDSREYNGKALTNKNVTVSGDGFIEGEGASYNVTGSQKVVGSSKNTFTYELDSKKTKAENYEITKHEGTLTITTRGAKYEITVEANSEKTTYDGFDHSAAGLKTSSFVVNGETYTVTGLTTENPTKKDAGTYTNNITGTAIVHDSQGNDVSSEFTVNTKNGSLVIEKAKVTLKSADLSKVYDGTELVNGNTPLAIASGFAAGESASYNFTGSQTAVGSSDNEFTVNWNGTTKKENYNVTTKFGTLEVTAQSIIPGPDPENPDPAYKGITINSPSNVPYDGNAHQWTPTVTDASGNVLVKGKDYTVSYDKDDFTNVTGEINVTITGKGNYKGKVVRSYQITPAPLTITTPNANKVYDGTALTAAGTIEGLVNNETVDFRMTGSQTEVGSSDNTYTLNWTGIAKESNYEITSVEIGTLVVTENAEEIVVTTTGGTFTYNGLAHGAAVTVSELPKGYTLETAESNASATDVTGATGVAATADNLIIRNAAGEDVTAKLNIKKVDGTIIVNPATLTITTPDASKVYDGTALTSAGTISGFVNNETATFATTGSRTEVGESENTYTLTWDGTAKAANYTVSDSIGKLRVTEQSIIPGPDPENPDPSYKGIQIDAPEDHIYDGAEHKWVPAVTDKDGKALTEGTDYEISYSKTDYTNVTGAIEVTITGKGNYTGSVTKSYQITPASVSIKTNSAEKVYDGKPLTADGEITGLVNNETVDFRTTGSQTEVGNSENTYTLSWTGTAKESNYQITSEEIGTLVVKENAKEIVVTTTGGTFTYDGLAHGAAVTVSELPKGYTLETAESSATATDVTKLPVKATADKLVIKNAQGKDVTNKLKITKIDGSIKVTPATLTITTPNASKVYDGTALTSAGTMTGLVNGETATFVTTGSQTEVGDSKNTYTLTWNGTAKEDNYIVSDTIGKLEVTKQSIIPGPDPENPDPSYKGITINDPSDVTYDGEEHKWTPTVTDKDGNVLKEGKDYEVSYNDKDDFTNVTGEIKVTIKGKGNYAGTVDKVYQITPKDVTITTDSATRVFNNQALTAPGRVTGIVDGETYKFTVTGKQTYVGNSINGYEMTWAKKGENKYTAKASNYKVTVETGTLTVTDGSTEEPVDPSLVVNKTHDTSKTYKVGDVITFTITVKNIYDEAKTITLAEQDGVTLDKTTFEDVKPGKEITAKATYTVTEADIIKGSFTNNVKAVFSGVDKEYTGTDVVDKFEESAPHMTITKTTKNADADHIYKLGDTISYVITVKNDGNLTLTNVKVEDALTGNAGENAWTIDTLAPGAEQTFETSYIVTEADVLAGKVVNNATGTADNPDPNKPQTPVTPGEKEDPVETQNPGLTVIKTADQTGEVKLGDKITYTITVVNTGNVTISGVELKDSLTGDSWKLGNIKPGEKVEKEAAYTVTEKDIIAGEVKNVAKATGKTPDQKDITSEGEKTVTTEESNPQITVTKETTSKPENGTSYALGEEITYKINVKNTGNLTLTDVKVIDELTGLEKTIKGEFKPGDEKSFETSYTVKESDLGKNVVNVATAEGTSPDPENPKPGVTPGHTEDPTDQKNPAMSITKKIVDKKDEYQIGDTIQYEITVKNTGNTTQNNVLVEDQMNAAGAATITKVEGAKGSIDGANVTLDTLKPGETATITAEYTVVKADRGNTITNAAVAKGEGENPTTPDVPAEVEKTYDIHVEHVFAAGEEGDVTLPEDYDIENLKPGTSKTLDAEAVEGYTAYPATKTVTIDNEDVTVTFVYYKDTIGTDPINPDQPDNIPDRYQVVVRFEAENGTVTHDHAVVTLFDENNEPAENGVGHLNFFQIAGARADEGYDQSSLSWSPETPTTRYEVTGAVTFTARFTATPVTPQDDPQNPQNPSNPQNPTNPQTPSDSNGTQTSSNSGVIDRVARAINNAPQTAANAVRNFAADVREVLNSDDGNVPLANQKLDDHDCCILHFLIMLLTAILYGFFTHNMKKRQKKNFELREELDTELAKRGLPTSREQEEVN